MLKIQAIVLTASGKRLILLLAALFLSGIPLSGHAQLPVNPTVVHGNVAIDAVGNHMTVTNSPNAIINWQSFSIGANESVHFQQQNAASQILNRVSGHDPSQIFGQLSSNGGVWLINPHGVLFGQNARIDVAGLVASTLDISNLDFMANRYRFNATGATGEIRNQGEIRTTFGGHVWLTGDRVYNEGLVETPGGNVVLAAGKSVEFVDTGAPNVIVRVQAPENEVVNLGALVSEGGSIDLHGSIVNQAGIIRANSIGTDTTGRIVLKADQINLAAGSETQAEQGSLQLEASTTLDHRGEISGHDVSLAADEILQQGRIQARGGKVTLAADTSTYLDGLVDVSDQQGAGGNIQINTRTLEGMAGGALRADGEQGGHIRVEGQDLVAFSSTLTATGKTQGGQIEVTGDQVLLRDANIDASGGVQGGNVHLGGGWQGTGDLPHARTVLIDAGSEVKADGGANTDIGGGEIVVWSTQSSEHYGLLQARGAGRIEFSSRGLIRPDGYLRVGAGGTVLFDPKDIFITSDSDIPSDEETVELPIENGVYKLPFDFYPEEKGYIASDFLAGLLGEGTDVILQASNDITVESAVEVESGLGGDLTLQAGRHVMFNADITINSGDLTVVVGDSGANAAFTDPGTPQLTIGEGVELGTGSGTTTLAVVGGDFINHSSSEILVFPSGRWLIYAADPATSNPGNLSDYGKHYNQPFVAGTVPEYAGSGNWLFYSIAPVLSVEPSNETMTYGDNVPNFTPTFSGFIDGDTQSSAGITGTAAWNTSGPFSSAAHLVQGAHDVSYTGGLASDLGYQFADNADNSDELAVSARSIAIDSFTASDKIYDGNTDATISNGVLAGLIEGDAVSLAGTGAFDDKHVGTDKPVTLTGAALTGPDHLNYVLDLDTSTTTTTTTTTTASITPATLTYLADQATRLFGAPATGLSGTVVGFMGDDTLASATTGTLAWATPATSTSPAGIYSVYGSGLSAGNYQFIQAEGNEHALVLQALDNRNKTFQQETVDTSIQNLNVAVSGTKALADTTPIGGGEVIDMVASATPLAMTDFGRLSLANMSRENMQWLVDYRKVFKDKLFSDAISRLERDPDLADVPMCSNLAETSSGSCMISYDRYKVLQSDSVKNQLSDAQSEQKTGQEARIAVIPQIKRKFAVLFGIDRYSDKTIPLLENAVFDAEAVGQLFASKLGYETHIVSNATRADIVRTFNQLAMEMRADDSLVIYYAGHGYFNKKTGGGYWIPSDASAKDPTSWVSNESISEMLAGIRSKQIVMISDSCYSGTFTREQKISTDNNINPVDILAKRSVIAMSSGGDEPVADEGRNGHSIFAWYLMQALYDVDRWQAGYNVFEEVRHEVKRSFPQTPQYGAITSAGHEGGDYLFEFRQLKSVQ